MVIGDKERQTGTFVVRDRTKGEQRKIMLTQLGDEINSLTNGKPYLPLNLPPYLSNRPPIMV